jgi:hypothetical protein
MNPLEVEKGVATYLRALNNLPAGTQVHESVSAADLNFEKQAVVVEVSDAEHRGPGAFLVNLTVSLRSPSMAVSLSDHSSLFGTLVTAIEAQSAFRTAFDAAATGVDFAGSYITAVPGPSFEDRAWINSMQVALGVAV